MSRTKSLRRRAIGACLSLAALAMLVAGCGLGPAPSPATMTPNAAPSSTAQPSGAAVSASPSEPRPWGPLAIIPPQGGSDTARLEGTLRITDACVFLDAVDPVLLFWPADQVLWAPETRTITFRNVDDGRVSVVRGDHVALGGSGDSTAESGVSGADWMKTVAVVAAPDPSCSLDVRWVVGALSREG